MNPVTHRRSFLKTAAGLCISLAVLPARACEYFTGTMRITHPWTRATGPDTFAVLCMRFDEVTETDRLVGVQTPVAADAELVGNEAGPELSLVIPEGRETLLSEEGTHIRLVGLKHPLLIARSYPLMLEFEKAGTVRALLNVDFMRPIPPSPGSHRSGHTPLRAGSGDVGG